MPAPLLGLGENYLLVRERVPAPRIKMRDFRLSPNPYFSIHDPVFYSLFSSTPTGVLAEMWNVLLPCKCVGCSIWWASLPELSQTISQPSAGTLTKDCLPTSLLASYYYILEEYMTKSTTPHY